MRAEELLVTNMSWTHGFWTCYWLPVCSVFPSVFMYSFPACFFPCHFPSHLSFSPVPCVLPPVAWFLFSLVGQFAVLVKISCKPEHEKMQILFGELYLTLTVKEVIQ